MIINAFHMQVKHLLHGRGSHYGTEKLHDVLFSATEYVLNSIV